MFVDDLGSGFDVVAHALLHNFAAEQCALILERARAALRPGGLLAVQDLERPGEGRTGSQISSLGSLLFLAAMGSRTPTAKELVAMVHGAGFVEIRVTRPLKLAGSLVVLARR